MWKRFRKITAVLLAIMMITMVIPFGMISVNAAYNYLFPVNNGGAIAYGYGYSASYGTWHDGIDIHSNGDDTIYAACDGVVEATANSCYHVSCGYQCEHYNTYGNYIRIGNSDGMKAYYGHLKQNSLLVSVGQSVKRGQPIATMGSSGYSTGKHLHFELRYSDYKTKVNTNPTSSNGEMNYSYSGHGNIGKNPEGYLESAIASVPDKLTIKGWAYDKDNINQSIYVDVYAFQKRIARITANKYREDVGKKYGVGNYHGFEETITMPQIGTYNIAVYAINIEGGKDTEIYYHSVTIPNFPQGQVESVIASAPDCITIKGWAFDKDDINASVYIDIYAFRNRVARITADKLREDIGSKYSVGNYHGFEETIHMPQNGTYNIAVYAMNIGEGKETEIYYQSITVPNYPTGEVESVISTSPNKLTIKGWAFDKDDINSSVYVDIYAFRNRVARITADKFREDIGNEYSVGDYHGFEETIEMPQSGTYNIAVYAMNIGDGKETNIYYDSVYVFGEEKYTIGDTNLDGKITISDVTAIQCHIAELEPFTEAQLNVADTNGDGKIDIADATQLQMYLAEYDGIVLGKQSA